MKAETVAKYFLNKDIDNSLFTDNSVTIDGTSFSNGNARLNKYLHIAQILFVAKYGKLLFNDNVYAFDNGGVVNSVRKNYYAIKNSKSNIEEDIPFEISNFLDKLYIFLKNAPLDELIQISHEDEEWNKRHMFYDLDRQKMNFLQNVETYKKDYADAIYVLDKL